MTLSATRERPFGFMESALALLLVTYLIKGLPALAFLPDLTVIAAGVTALAVAYTIWRQLAVPRSWGPLLTFFALWLPGLLIHTWGPLTAQKSLFFYTLTLLSALAPTVLIQSHASLSRLLNAMALLGAVVTVVAGIEFVTSRGALYRLDVEGTNTIAVGRGVGMALLWVLVMAVYRRWRALPTALLVLPLAGLLLSSGSRGPLIGALLGAIVLLAPRVMRRGNGRLAVAFALVAGGVALAVPYLPSASVERVAQFFTAGASGELDSSASARGELWAAAWDAGLVNPLGVGVGRYSEVTNVIVPPSSTPLTYPHNLWLEVWAEAGWLPGLLLLALTLWAVRNTWVARRDGTETSALLLLMLLFWAMCHAVSSDVNGAKPLFALIAISISSWMVSRRHQAAIDAKDGEPMYA
ncbi:O-antigen ligase family protein [Deinococcus aerophilus]|uniref:O-antigen ligase-related domain-containing protein n=1 Tax=Deinococcus aerophilus TaxID=522488 RepID=A0ABQ2GU06_9DEIO|nr:O-antigen ligase family protein [Deinococcus aerophilus]GGM13213.1 hypothetical protein GCM10010841_22290 [Deinococcus aerophilus]